ncbi:BamA/TamA family outer membrane protein [Ferruginibacter albus]|uniref:hypothetical protein n=1 Tax=Ferruginibacter albus TaxID=2875540 RepID=UPI001CC5DE06|nr:hypothetical protein [Ferruginibacter albus]UAY53422.1 hypothetical protein K9M53_07050 [Ferruginibacter albus]
MKMKCKVLLTTFLSVLLFLPQLVNAQQPTTADQDKDTFFLAKKRGLIGELGRSMAVGNPVNTEPVKIANPFQPFAGRIIKSIQIVRLGFDRNINDTEIIRHSFGLRIAKKFHKNTVQQVIKNNLLFKTGQTLFPNLMADNERLLREQIYIQDARILVKFVPGSIDSVDVIVLTKDVFSIGGILDIGSTNKFTFGLSEDNLNGRGTRLAGSSMFDKSREPKFGYGAEFVNRNMKGSFIDWTLGFKTYEPAYVVGRNEETHIYTTFSKPLVTPYIPWTGALTLSFNKDNNLYNTPHYDSVSKYQYYNIDGWFGYNFGATTLLRKNRDIRLRKLLAVRVLHMHFNNVPLMFGPPDGTQVFNYYKYVNVTGALGAFNVFKQDFYRTNFIYGFGRNEDVPQGFNAALTGGWTNQNGRERPYFGLDGELSLFSRKAYYNDITVRIGGYRYQNKFEDFNILLNLYHFTKLKKINPNWYRRYFLTASVTKQIKPTSLTQALFLQSGPFGLPYVGGPLQTGDFRATLKPEAVFFNLKKFLGFRFAPFLFGNATMLTPTGMPVDKSVLYSAWGGGVRTRNENLVFGTMELRGYYIPRTLPGVKGWRVEVSTNLQFKFNSTFVKQPDFIIPN